jgi:hypothetical protein
MHGRMHVTVDEVEWSGVDWSGVEWSGEEEACPSVKIPSATCASRGLFQRSSWRHWIGGVIPSPFAMRGTRFLGRKDYREKKWRLSTDGISPWVQYSLACGGG